MNVLLSIKPEFAEKILSNEKRYEFRKTNFRDYSAIDTVFMYASSPTKQIVGVFSISNVIKGHPDVLWERFSGESGFSDYERYGKYFLDTDMGYAIEIENAIRLKNPINPREHIENFHPPVSFQYSYGELDFVFQLV